MPNFNDMTDEEMAQLLQAEQGAVPPVPPVAPPQDIPPLPVEEPVVSQDSLPGPPMTEDSWYMVRNTPGVTGFVGMGNDPTALQPEEVARILKRMESESPRINVTFRPGERIRIVDGPFEDFYGKVAEIDMERATVRVMVNFFGRETPVELDFLQVEEA